MPPITRRKAQRLARRRTDATDLRTSYIRALGNKVGPIRAEGRIVHLGCTTALAEGRLYEVDERLYAVGSTACLILQMPS